MQEEIRKTIEKAVGQKGVLFSVEIPTVESHGDYSTNVALVLAKSAGKQPREIAEEIKQKLEKNKLFSKVEIAGPGFINLFLNESVVIAGVKSIGTYAGANKSRKGENIIVEHTQPNPFKQFHIGHLMNNAIGESVSRILKANGAKVKIASYHGDVGLHVAKAIWAMKQGISLQEAYAKGHEAYETGPAKEEIITINKKLYEGSDKELNVLYKEGRKESLAQFEKLYTILGSQFDFRFYESEAGNIGKQLVLKNVGKVFSKGENGAIIFQGENFLPKTHTRVFLNSEGLPTYEAKEVGLAQLKKKAFRYDRAVTVTASEQDSFFKVVEVAIGEVFPDVKGRLQHLSHGMLKLPSGKMSSRTGTVITAESLIEQVSQMIREKNAELSAEDVQKIAIGAIKYSIVKQSIGSDIIYDFNKSISFEGDSGPYLQYSYTRAGSILKKAKAERVKPSFKKPAEMTKLEKMLCQFEDVVERAGVTLQPNDVALYLAELASAFNGYYAKHVIVDKDDESSAYRVALTQAFAYVMQNGLWLLGISVPQKM